MTRVICSTNIFQKCRMSSFRLIPLMAYLFGYRYFGIMKKLLVLTDFTACAAHAAQAAVRLAAQLGDDLVLYHTMPYVPLIPSDGGGPYVTEVAHILTEDSQAKLAEVVTGLQQSPDCHTQISQQSGEGGLGSQIAELTGPSDIELVVMGGRTGGALDHLFQGSDTSAVIRKARKPVLIIPVSVPWRLPATVVFATDYSVEDISAVSFLQELSLRVGFTLKIVHVLWQDDVVSDVAPGIAFGKFLAERRLSCEQTLADSVHEGLVNYCSKHHADILAMSHRHHSFVGRLFSRSESRSVIADGALAVLVFPPEYQHQN